MNSLKRRLARKTGRPLYRAENVPSIKASIAKYEKGVCRRRAPATIIFWASLINREFAAALILSIANIVTMILAIETLDCRVTFRDIAHRNESKAARLAGLVPNGSKSSLSVRSVHFKARIMKVALNPAELGPIVDALDDKHQFQLQSGEGRRVGIKKWGLQPGQVSNRK